MTKYRVIKSIQLVWEGEATSEEHAEQLCCEADEDTLELRDCQYTVYEEAED